VKNKVGDVESKTVGNEEEACARKEEVCARKVDWEQSLFMTRTEFPKGEGSTSTSPLPRFPTPGLEWQQSDETTTVYVHPHMCPHEYSYWGRTPTKPWVACPLRPLRHYPPQKPARAAQEVLSDAPNPKVRRRARSRCRAPPPPLTYLTGASSKICATFAELTEGIGTDMVRNC